MPHSIFAISPTHSTIAPVTPLEETLSYQFSDVALLKEALSHPSLSSEMRPAPPDNQRLEYLGDAVLELVITDFLFKRFPDQPEGPLTKLRASIVSKPCLAKVAKRLGLGGALFMSNGESSSGGRDRASNLADALEAIIGAIYLDSGLEAAQRVLAKALAPELAALDPQSAQIANSKGRLQEILQKITPEAPSYQLISEEGPPHNRIFTSTVTWGGKVLGIGSGLSKKIAETQAAATALETGIWK
ncbi:ribonuclease III [Akkermansiaceae bacterium]|nr:ribonuclease III [Akkermansiaceae bacterium]MDB4437536.1 ribonuclease III [bacterium]MDB4273033.1 ribonuclease III [Akkermansiaceae bacterium]MDB4284210.1 ribonuclease III [Akkermansiaceae bacterium]MDB4295375.1 ribonuclease III [Akkermansiaceae bacterium]